MLSELIYGAMLLSLFSLCCLADDHGSHVVKLSSSSYSTEVPGRNTFVMFFAPWCGHCKRLAPTWDELGEKYNKPKDRIVTIAKVDCTTDTDLCSNEDVTGYPTLKFFPIGKEAVRYRGPRDLEALETFLKEHVGAAEKTVTADTVTLSDGPTDLTDISFHDHVEKGMHFVKFYAPWCGHCQKLAPTWEELAEGLKEDPAVSISKINCVANRARCNEFEIKGYPTLLWIQDGRLVEKYQGGRTYDELKKYVIIMKAKSSDQIDASDEMRVADLPPAPVAVLTSETFSPSIAEGYTFVKFFAPWCGHCKKLAPTWEDLARKLAGQHVSIAEVDCSAGGCKDICQEQKIEGYPTIFLYKNGKKVQEYSGNRDLESLYSFVMSNIKQHDEL